jgi:hypothetical protein
VTTSRVGRATAIVVAPELEIWAWNDVSSLGEVLGWRGGTRAVRHYLEERGLWRGTDPKPRVPKDALEALLRERRIRRSSAIYRRLAAAAQFEPCTDPAFRQFREVVQHWFRRQRPS